MSLAIDTLRIKAVLLADGKWHAVKDASLNLDMYEFKEGDKLLLGAGGATVVSEMGARWQESKRGERLACPLSSILAVKYKK